MYRQTDGRMDGQMDVGTDGWIERRMNGYTDGWKDGGWMQGQTDEWMYGQTDGYVET